MIQPKVRKFLVLPRDSSNLADHFSSITETCPADPALGKAISYDFTKGASQDFSVSTGAAPTFGKDGAVFSISKSGEAPTMSSKWYMMFGHYDVVMKAAPGTGIVSSLVLQSDDLDEVDLEWLGVDNTNVQSNYYGKGNTQVYDRGANLTNPGSQDNFHTYSVDWTADHITWSIDGKTLRTLTPQTADKDQYPQSPMQLKIGSWAAGDPSQPKGTIAWSGGAVDYSKGPFLMTVQSVKAIDYSTGKEYSYGDMSGTWQSIKSNGGSIKSTGNAADADVSDAQVDGSSVTATTAVSITQVPVTVASSLLSLQTVTTAASNQTTSAAGSGSTATATPTGSGSSSPSQTGSSSGSSSSGSSGSSNSSSTGSGSGSGSSSGSDSGSGSGSGAGSGSSGSSTTSAITTSPSSAANSLTQAGSVLAAVLAVAAFAL